MTQIQPSDLEDDDRILLGLLVEHLTAYRSSHIGDDYQLPNFQSGIITGISMATAEVRRLTIRPH